MPSVNATERAMPTVGNSESMPLGVVAIEMDSYDLGPDLQKLRSIERVGDGQSSAQLFSQYCTTLIRLDQCVAYE